MDKYDTVCLTLNGIEKKMLGKRTIDQNDQKQLNNLIPQIYSVASKSAIDGEFEKVSDVYLNASTVFSMAAGMSDESNFSKKADILAGLWNEKANFEEAAKDLRVDTHTVRTVHKYFSNNLID